MKRINIRIPDTTLAALRRELDRERKFRGQRYSMNDHCVRKLGISVAASVVSVERGESVVDLPRRVPPPPPVPMPTLAGPLMPWQREEPQPERAIRPQEHSNGEPEADTRMEASHEGVAALEVVENVSVSEPDEVARMESEGGPDGNLDD